MEFAFYNSLKKIPDSGEDLFAAAERKSLYLSYPWFKNLIETGLGDNQVFFACVEDKERVIAILPLMFSDPGHLRSLGHIYSYLSGMLCADEANEEIFQCLAAGLRKLPAVSLRIEPVADDDPHMAQLQHAMEKTGYVYNQAFRYYNWIHRTQGRNYRQYMEERPARVRNTVARKQRKLDREHDYRVHMFIGEDIDQALADYDAVYRSSWKAHELFDDFLKGFAHGMAEQQWLRLAVLYIDNQPAAAQFWIVSHGKASIFKLAYDQKWKAYSPGSILIAYLMEYVIDKDKVDEIDFLMGNDAYKQDWMTERRVRFGHYFAIPKSVQNEPVSWLARIKRAIAPNR